MKDKKKIKKRFGRESATLRQKNADQSVKKKQPERAPKRSEHSFQALAESANDGILIAASSGNYVFANKRAAEITGYSIPELLKIGLQGLTHPDEVTKVTERYQKRLLGEPVPHQYETVIVRKNGKNVPIELTAAKTTWEGQPAGLAIIRDVTMRKQSEEELKSSEERLRILFESAPDAYYLNDLEGNFVNGNKAAEELIGYKREELIGKNFLKLKLLPPGQIPKAAAALAKNVLGKPTGPDEFVLNRKDGQKVIVEIRTFPVQIEDQHLVLGIAHDITDRKRAEEALWESEKKYHRLVETSVDGVVSTDSQMKIALWNHGAEKIFGYTEKEMLGQGLLKIVPRKYRKATERGFVGFKKNGSGPVVGKTLELVGLRKNGQEVPVELSVSSRKAGRRYIATAVVRDITERKQTEEELRKHREHLEEIVEERTAELVEVNEELQQEIARRREVEAILRESERELRSSFEQANDCVIHLDTSGIILNINEKTLQVFGGAKEGLLGKNFLTLEIFSPKDKPALMNSFEETLSGKTTLLTMWIENKNGQAICLECSANLIKLGDEISGVTVIGRDVTERKRIQDALRAAEQEKAAILDSMSELVAYQDTEMTVLWANRAAGKSVGLPPEQLIGRHCYEIWHGRSEPCEGCPVKKALQTGQQQATEITSPNGRMWFIRGYPVRDEKNEIAGVVEVTLEITEQKRAEDALRESEEKFRTLAEKSPNMIFINKKNQVVYANKKCEEIMGYKREEFYSPDFDFLTLIAPEYIELVKKSFSKHLKGKEIAPYEYALLTKGGQTIEAIYASKLIHYEGEKAILGIVTDITERKKAEENLKDSEIRFRTLFEKARDAVFIADTESGIIVDANKEAEKLLKRSRRDIIGLHQTELHPQKDSGKYKKMFLEHIRSNGSSTMSSEVITADGDIVPIEVNASVIEVGGKKLIQGIFRDITERKRSEEKLRQSEERFRDITANALEWVWEVDANGKYTYSSPVIEKILGYKPEEVLQKHFYDLFLPEDREELKKAAFEIFALKQPFREFINRNVHKNGDIVWLSTSGVPIHDEKGKLLGYRGADTDITERKQAEEKLRESEENFRDLFENANDLVQSVTPDEHFQYVNRAWRETLGYSEEEVAELSLFDVIHPNSQAHCMEVFQQILSGGKVDRVEASFVAKDGREIIVEGSANCRFKDGKPFATRGIFRDITKRKRMEEKLRDSFETLQKTYQDTISALASSVEMRDTYTAGHQRRVTQLACAIAKEMGLPAEQIQGLRLAGLVHDIGKINVPTEILAKPNRLTETEFNLIKTHPQIGYDILKMIEFPWPVAQMVLQHHERIDGSGYPSGLAGDDVLLTARILAVADVVEAISSHRPYRKALGRDEAFQELSRQRGILYDPQAVDACLRLFLEKGFVFE